MTVVLLLSVKQIVYYSLENGPQVTNDSFLFLIYKFSVVFGFIIIKNIFLKILKGTFKRQKHQGKGCSINMVICQIYKILSVNSDFNWSCQYESVGRITARLWVHKHEDSGLEGKLKPTFLFNSDFKPLSRRTQTRIWAPLSGGASVAPPCKKNTGDPPPCFGLQTKGTWVNLLPSVDGSHTLRARRRRRSRVMRLTWLLQT